MQFHGTADAFAKATSLHQAVRSDITEFSRCLIPVIETAAHEAPEKLVVSPEGESLLEHLRCTIGSPDIDWHEYCRQILADHGVASTTELHDWHYWDAERLTAMARHCILSDHAEHVTFNTPSGSTYRILRSKDNLLNFLKTIKNLLLCSASATDPSNAVKLASPAYKAAQHFCSPQSPGLNQPIADGPYTVATDLYRMAVLLDGSGEEAIPFLFPHWRNAVPRWLSLEGMTVKGGRFSGEVAHVDVAELFSAARQAVACADADRIEDTRTPLPIYLCPRADEEGIGLRYDESDDCTFFESSGVEENAPYHCVIDLRFLEGMLRQAHSLGIAEMQMYVPDPIKGVFFLAPGVGFFMLQHVSFQVERRGKR